MPSVMPVANAASRSAFEANLIVVVTLVMPFVSWKVTVMIDGSLPMETSMSPASKICVCTIFACGVTSRTSFAIAEEEQQIDVNCSRCMILTPRDPGDGGYRDPDLLGQHGGRKPSASDQVE